MSHFRHETAIAHPVDPGDPPARRLVGRALRLVAGGAPTARGALRDRLVGRAGDGPHDRGAVGTSAAAGGAGLRGSWRKGADAGSGHAAANLGNLYETGALNNGEPEYERAADCYKTAIRLGYAEARGALDNLHAATGVPAVMTDVPRAKSGVLWKRLLGLR